MYAGGEGPFGAGLAAGKAGAGFSQSETMMTSIGYVVAGFPVSSETLLRDELRALSQVGRASVSIVMRRSEDPAEPAERELANEAQSLTSVSWRRTLSTLMRPTKGAIAAIVYVLRQRRLPRRSLIWNAMKIAAIAQETGCRHLHAHVSGGAAAHAIVAARWIGASVSFACHGEGVCDELEDLPVKLAAADVLVAICSKTANALPTLVPQADAGTIGSSGGPERFRPGGPGAPQRRFLFIGRQVERRNIDDFLIGLFLRGSTSIELVGDRGLADRLRCQAEALRPGGGGRFAGAGTRDGIAGNPAGCVTLEAGSGSPLVVEDTIAMRPPAVTRLPARSCEVTNCERAFLSERDDPVSLAMAVTVAMRDEDGAAMGRRVRQHILDRFSVGATSRALSAAFWAA